MNNLKKLQTMNIDQLVEWLDTNGHHDATWWKWFEEKYCNNCESEIVYVSDFDRECRCAYCETRKNCRFFPEMEDVPDSKETIKLWLEAEVEDEEV